MCKNIFETLAASVVMLILVFVGLWLLGWCEDHPVVTVCVVLAVLLLAFRHELKLMGRG